MNMFGVPKYIVNTPTHKVSCWSSLQSFGPSFLNIMTELNSLARARVMGPEGGAEDGAAGVGVGEGAAGVDVLVLSSSLWTKPEKMENSKDPVEKVSNLAGQGASSNPKRN
jgi:hypothetical protein